VPSRDGKAQKAPQATFSNKLRTELLGIQLPQLNTRGLMLGTGLQPLKAFFASAVFFNATCDRPR